jgi:8-oxo-dGTP pyrophosphatase MutT (NUDIX family)
VKHEIRDSKLVFGEFFRIERAEVRWTQVSGVMGGYRTRYAIRRGDSAGIVPVLGARENPRKGLRGEGKIVLVRQFRYPAAKGGCDGYLWEIPAGMLAGGETPAETARRELREEIGVEAETLDPLVSFYLSPGALDEMLHLFSAMLPPGTLLGATGGNEEEHEDLEVRAFSIPELRAMIERREIVDAKTIAGILYYINMH